MVGDDIGQLVDTQRSLETKFENVMDKKAGIKGSSRAAKEMLADTAREAGNIGADLKNSTHLFARGLKQSPLTPDNLEKTQADRWV